jgi:DNA-directed RNA polymerase specialized sigma24 family protein
MVIRVESECTRKEGHVWSDLEWSFQLVIGKWKKNKLVSSRRFAESIAHVADEVESAAKRLMPQRDIAVRQHLPADAAQSWWGVMLRRNGGFHKYDGKRDFHPYGYFVLKRICFEKLDRSSQWRKTDARAADNDARRNPFRKSSPRLAASLPIDYDPGDDRFNPLRNSIRSEVAQHVRQKVDGLSPALKRAIIGFFFDGHCYEQLAAKEDVSIDAIYLRICRGLERLRSELDAYRSLHW